MVLSIRFETNQRISQPRRCSSESPVSFLFRLAPLKGPGAPCSKLLALACEELGRWDVRHHSGMPRQRRIGLTGSVAVFAEFVLVAINRKSKKPRNSTSPEQRDGFLRPPKNP